MLCSLTVQNSLGETMEVWLQVAKQRELRLIENQHLLKDAPVQHEAEAL